jgi:NAD(P)-dependent dehydrogenase (short-subunit alcohol dehydrogenase family)
VRGTGHGDIVLVASTSVLFGGRQRGLPRRQLRARVRLARTLKNEIVRIAPRGRVNVVAPGWTVTAAAAVTDELVEAATQTMPLKKIATREKWLGPSSGSLRPSTLHTAAVRSSR